MIGHTQPVFQFLCPLDKLLNEEEHYGGVWGILSGLAYFLTPGHEEEEVSLHIAAFCHVDISKNDSYFCVFGHRSNCNSKIVHTELNFFLTGQEHCDVIRKTL